MSFAIKRYLFLNFLASRNFFSKKLGDFPRKSAKDLDSLATSLLKISASTDITSILMVNFDIDVASKFPSEAYTFPLLALIVNGFLVSSLDILMYLSPCEY